MTKIVRPVPGKACDLDACPNKTKLRGKCRCRDKCLICGGPEHISLHGPCYGQPPGSEPWHHEFKPTSQGEPKV